jgi:hypothetical protein
MADVLAVLCVPADRAIACGTAGTCVAVGGATSSLGGTSLLAESWNGARWATG